MEDEKFGAKLVDVINSLRNDLEEGIPLMEEFKEYLLTYYPNKKSQLKQLDIIYRQMSQGEVESLDDIQLNPTLSDLANNILQEIEDKPGTDIYPEADNYLMSTVPFFFSGIEKCRNLVSTEDTPKKVVQDLLINLNAFESGHHLLLDPTINYIGIAHDYVKDKPVTVIIISDSVKEREETSLDEALIYDINILRNLPRVALKIMKESSLTDLIKTKRPCYPLNINEKLAKAAVDRFEELDKENQPLSGSKLTKYLSKYGSGHLTSGEILINDPFSTALDIIQILLSREDSINFIFNNQLREIGFAIDLENGTAVMLLANKFEDPIEEIPNEIDVLRRRLVRPKLTNDELIQIENDFNKFDILKRGRILPRTMCIFMDKNEQYKELNPWYYQAFKSLNTEDNNKEGVDLKMFIEAVKDAIATFNRLFEKNWERIFVNIAGGDEEVIGKKQLSSLVKDLGYTGSSEEISLLIERLEGDIDKNKFLEVCKIIEYRFARFRSLLINKIKYEGEDEEEEEKN